MGMFDGVTWMSGFTLFISVALGLGKENGHSTSGFCGLFVLISNDYRRGDILRVNLCCARSVCILTIH